MLSSGTFKIWYLVHRWTSLICTVFLLLLCLTGLPLVFSEEINDVLSNKVDPPEMAANAPRARLDPMVEEAKARRPGEFVTMARQPRDEPNTWWIRMGLTPDAQEESAWFIFDARTGKLLYEYKDGLMHVLYKLHVDLFAGPEGSVAGLAGMLFLGFMGLLFVASLVSGVVVYGPFMRKLPFGAVRHERAPRLQWLDLHNLLGIVLVAWMLVVGVTGVINTLSRPIYSYWQSTELVEMIAPWRGKPVPTTFASLDRVVQAAQAAEPTMKPNIVWFPGQARAGNHHYVVFMRGDTPLTRRLQKPMLIDAQTGEFITKREMPLYAVALRVSQPLHFGDYGGIPLKVLWAVLDLITIVVLGSGLYLWFARRETPIEVRIAEIERAEAEVTAAAAKGATS